MAALDSLLQMVKDSVMTHTADQQQAGFNPSGLLSHIDQIFGQHAAQAGTNVRPASQDPYGDPADGAQGGKLGNVRPASQDPYGDPAEPAKR